MLNKQAELPYSGPVTAKQAFVHPDAHPLLLNLLLLREMGADYLAWEPETIWAEIQSTWGTTVSDVNKQKIQAVRACYVSDSPYEDWQAYEKVTAGLFGVVPRKTEMQRPSPGRALVALDVLGHIREDKRLSPEVVKYCAAVLIDHGMVYGPGALAAANTYISKQAEPEVSALQSEVAAAYKRKARPNPTGAAAYDVQYDKVLSVSDFAASMSHTLGAQTQQLTRG